MDNIEAFKNKKVLVVGDVMLDEHIWSRVTRISPEAPVPIAEVLQVTHVPGGAANVAANIRSLGGEPLLIGVAGKDSSGDRLIRALKEKGIGTSLLVRTASRHTTLKSRVIAAHQHVVRVDREDTSPVGHTIEKRLLASLKKSMSKSDAVIISDYGKGSLTGKVISSAIALAKRRKIPVSVDPKGKDFRKYGGATVITPNAKEASVASGMGVSGDASVVRAGRKLIGMTRCKYVLITRGEKGMSLVSRTDVVHVPAIPKDVFDITGAGDTVVGTFTLALAAGASMKEAVTLSNYAASVVIGKVGTATVSFDELLKSAAQKAPPHKKIKQAFELREILKKKKAAGRTVVFTNGCFDLLHIGHVRCLEEAKKHGDILVVGLNSDASVRKLKGRGRPLMPQNERAEILAALEPVDYVTIFDEANPNRLITELKPDVDIKGGDYKSPLNLPEEKIVRSYGGKVIIATEIKGKSTSKLLERIKRDR